MGKWLFNTLFPNSTKTYKEKLVECVESGMTGNQIKKEMNIDYSTVHDWLRKLGLNLPNHHNELKFDNTVFDCIDTEEKSYWLGFLYADGYVKKKGNTVELSLKGDDVDHLKKFNSFLKNKIDITMGTSKCGNKMFSRCRLAVTDKHFHDKLIELGCFPQKSLILKFPSSSIFASEGLIRHFIRGYFDGDGFVTCGCTGYAVIGIIGTSEFLEGIKNYYPEYFTTIYHKDARHSNSNTFILQTYGKKATQLGEVLYSNASIFLQRKYQKFIENKYDERKHFERMHTVSERKQLYFNRSRNRNRQNCDLT